jgi:hypothetical protein
MIVLGRKGIAQHAIDPLPGREHLRAFDSQPHASGDVEQLARARHHAELADIEPERFQMRDQFRLRHDPGAAAGQLALHALEDVDNKAAPPKHDRGEEPAHRAADDDRAPLADGICHGKFGPDCTLFQKPRGFSIFCPESLEERHGSDHAG